MGLQSAMTTALTGLQAAETTIDVVGNNVANSNTVGFKESNVLFATQFLQTQSIGSAPSTSSGGTNPRQIGLGVTVAEIAPDFTQGTIQVSANPLDLAIQGDGFFMVQGSAGGGQTYYSRNGQFKTNAENELISVTGNRVLGYGINDEFQINTNEIVPITIPFGGSAVAQETNNVKLVGNLLPNSEGVSHIPGVIDSAILSNNAIEIPDNIGVGDIAGVGPPDISAAVVAGTADASSQITAGRYAYRVVFRDDTPGADSTHNEGPPSVAFGDVTITGAGTDSIQLTNIPVSTDAAVFGRKALYRLNLDVDPNGQYEFVTELDESITTYTDSAADSSLGAALNDDSVDQANYNYFYTFSSPNLESRPTNQSATQAISTSNRRLRLEDIPQPVPGSQFTTVKIYRNVLGEPGNFYLVDEIPAGVTSYVDNTPDADIKDPTKLLDRNGPKINTALPLVNVSTFDGTNYVNLFQPGVLQFTGSKGANGGLDLAPKELTITVNTTVLDLITFVSESLGIQTTSPDPDNPLSGNPGGALSGTSQLHFESNNGVHNAVTIDQNAFRLTPTGGLPQTVPLTFSSSNTVNAPVDGTGSSSEMIAYDSLGIPLTVRLTTVLESTDGGVTTYRWYAASPDNQPASGVSTTVGTGIITFNGSGKFISATNDTVTIDRRDVASNSPVTFDLDFSQVTALSQSSSGIQASSQDGFAAGTLSNFSITESGRIKGVYTNGVTRDLGQMLMARFSNAGGLQQIGDNLWAEGVNSGEPLIGIPGASGIGSLTAGAVELSNTDIGQNLIDLILASTQYRGGTRVITSAQQLLDELLNLRR